MNRVLNRPMFKMGGSSGTGITSGLDQPRKQYANGTQMPNFQMGGLPGFLTGFGLNLLATPPRGNIFQTAATAAKDPFQTFQAATGTDISRLGQLGALNQAQAQANLDAQREAARQATFLPQQNLDRFAAQVTGIMGGYPGQTQTTNVPNPTPLQTALGVGTTLAGIYGAFNNPSQTDFGRFITGTR